MAAAEIAGGRETWLLPAHMATGWQEQVKQGGRGELRSEVMPPTTLINGMV